MRMLRTEKSSWNVRHWIGGIAFSLVASAACLSSAQQIVPSDPSVIRTSPNIGGVTPPQQVLGQSNPFDDPGAAGNRQKDPIRPLGVAPTNNNPRPATGGQRDPFATDPSMTPAPGGATGGTTTANPFGGNTAPGGLPETLRNNPLTAPPPSTQSSGEEGAAATPSNTSAVPEPQSDSPAGQARDLIEQGKNAEALELLDEAAKTTPAEDAATLFFRGTALRNLGRYDDAIEQFGKAIAMEPDNGEIYLRRGIAWFYKGEYQIAERDFDDVLRIVFEDARASLWKGMAFARQRRYVEAIETYTQAIRLNENFPLAYNNRGLAYVSMGEYRKAIADFNQMIRLTPNDATAYYKRAVAQQRDGQTARAVDSYSAAIRLDPKYADAYFNRSLAHQRLGDSRQARSDRNKARQLNPRIESELLSVQ